MAALDPLLAETAGRLAARWANELMELARAAPAGTLGAEVLLAAAGTGQLGAEIREQRDDYYRILEQTQRATLDVTPWMEWFLACLTRAIERAQTAISGAIARARFWERLRDIPLNDRQRLVIGKLVEGLAGTLTSSKWAALTKCSQDSALRDIQQLVERGVLVRNPAGGRSTSYSLANLSAAL